MRRRTRGRPSPSSARPMHPSANPPAASDLQYRYPLLRRGVSGRTRFERSELDRCATRRRILRVDLGLDLRAASASAPDLLGPGHSWHGRRARRRTRHRPLDQFAVQDILLARCRHSKIAAKGRRRCEADQTRRRSCAGSSVRSLLRREEHRNASKPVQQRDNSQSML